MPNENLPQPTSSQHETLSQTKAVTPPQPLKVLVVWKAPARVFVKHDREFYTTVGAIIFLICIILLFLKEFLFILVIIAFAFFAYVLFSTPPELVEHEITSRGVRSMGKLYYWDQLGRYWIDQRVEGTEVLYIENFAGLPTRLMMLLEKRTGGKVKEILKNHLLNERPEKTSVERAGDWLQEKVSLEKSPSPKP
ncbi:MAG: hypothetical protein ACOX6V_05955 [Patescibacteria group bacterium]|jgi:hypothetical protein